MVAHVFTGWAVPVSVGDDHQRGAETGCVERRITLVTQQQLKHKNGHSIYMWNASRLYFKFKLSKTM